MTVRLTEKNKSEFMFIKANYKTWENIIKIYSVYDAVFGITEDGKIFYDGYYGDIDEKEIKTILL